ncbi:hypothetical protein BDV97DRAFT_353592 [Delphinella strobiligena]|nr:hypothetical protein BDV97DRAFT_353592 [Delphinella strobiligena]
MIESSSVFCVLMRRGSESEARRGGADLSPNRVEPLRREISGAVCRLDMFSRDTYLYCTYSTHDNTRQLAHLGPDELIRVHLSGLMFGLRTLLDHGSSVESLMKQYQDADRATTISAGRAVYGFSFDIRAGLLRTRVYSTSSYRHGRDRETRRSTHSGSPRRNHTTISDARRDTRRAIANARALASGLNVHVVQGRFDEQVAIFARLINHGVFFPSRCRSGAETEERQGKTDESRVECEGRTCCLQIDRKGWAGRE